MKRFELYAWRRQGRQISVAGGINGPHRGVNLHRHGGVSFTGFPASGGATIAWGRLRAKGDALDRHMVTQRRRIAIGPVAIRIGRDF